jgi:hypothetical protein
VGCSRLAVLLLAPLVVLPAACGGGDDTGGLPTVSSTPTESSSSTPASTPTPTVAPTTVPATGTQKYGALTLVINHKPTPPANAALALRAYDEFEQSSHKSLATNVEDAGVAKRSAGTALKDIRSVLQDQKAKKVRTGGLVTLTTRVVRVSGAVAALDTCYDQSKSVLVRADGSTYVGPGTKKNPELKASVILVNVAALWKVSEYNLKAGPC